MVTLENGDVNIGDVVFYDNKLGIFESLYENRMNVRMKDDNKLHTVELKTVKRASEEDQKKWVIGEEKAQLIEQAKRLKQKFKQYDMALEVRQATAQQKEEWRKEEQEKNKAANIGPLGNIITETKTDDDIGFPEGARVAPDQSHPASATPRPSDLGQQDPKPQGPQHQQAGPSGNEPSQPQVNKPDPNKPNA